MVRHQQVDLRVRSQSALDDIAQGGAQTSIASLSDEERAAVDGKFVSAFIRAQRP